MAGYNNADLAVTLPNYFESPGQTMKDIVSRRDRLSQQDQENAFREKQFQAQQKERDEQSMYHKIGLVQDLTDLTKYQTSDDVANALGMQKANQIKSNYINKLQSGQITLPELVAGISKDISNTQIGMMGVKNEHQLFDANLQELKKQFPDLDIAGLTKQYRADLGSRRMANGTDFTNPSEVKQSDILQNMLNPDFISKYTTGVSNLEQYIQNPKGADEKSIISGNFQQSIPYKGKVPFWREVTGQGYNPNAQFQAPGFVPQTQIKAQTLSEQDLPAAKGDFKVIDKGVYDQFNKDIKNQVDISKAARATFPQYDSFSPIEKEYAKRNALYNMVDTLDKSGFVAEHPIRAQVTNVHIPKEEKGLEGRKWMDNITGAIDNNNIEGVKNQLKQLYGGKGFVKADIMVDKKTGKLTNAEVTLTKKENGEDVTEIKKINLTDEYRDPVLVGLYQDIMGKEVKMKTYQSKPTSTPSNTASNPTDLLKSYDENTKVAIDAYKRAQNLTLEQALDKLKKAGKIK